MLFSTRSFFSATGLLAAWLLAAPAHAQAPANDDCAGALPVPVAALGSSCASFTASNANATATAGVPDPGCAYSYQGGDVWYTLTVPASGALRVTSSAVAGSTVDDTQLTLYSGSCGALTEVGCNDDFGNDYFADLSLGGRTPGEVLYLRAATYGNYTSGEFALCVRELPPCAAPTGLAVSGITARRATISYVPNGLARYYIITYTPAGGAAQTEYTNDASRELSGLTPGTTYTVTVASDCNGSQPDSAPITFTTGPPPANDDCTGAVALAVTTACTTPLLVVSEGATASPGVADPSCGNYYGNDLWYSVTVPANGVLMLETGSVSGSNVYNTDLAVYTGSCGSLVPLACNDNDSGVAMAYLRLTGLTPGATLYVRVWVAYGGSGNYTLCATTDDALPITTWTGTASSDWFDAANWTAGVPTATTNAFIQGAPHSPSLSDAGLTAEVHTLSIDKYAGFTFTAGTLAVGGNLRRRNPYADFYDSSNSSLYTGGTVELRGTAPQQVSGLSEVYDLRLHGSSTATLTSELRLFHHLTMDGGVLDTGPGYVELYSDDPFLGEFVSTARLVHESETSYVLGRIQTRRGVDQNVREDFSGLGVTMFTTSSNTPGGVQVNRFTGTAPAGASGITGIRRVYHLDASQDTGLDLTLDLHYFAHERNNLADADLRPYSSPLTGSSSNNPGTATGPWTLEGPGTRLAPVAPDSASTVRLTGLTHLSAWTLGVAAAPLPVSLVAFTAEPAGPDALLRWTTATELHNAYFEAEASPDGRTYRPVGRVPGHGTTQQPQLYTLRDANLARYHAPVVYYRLRQVDVSGHASYSPVRALPVPGAPAAGPTAYPNPFSQTLTVRLPAPATGPVLLVLRDALGREVLRQTTPAPETQEVPLTGTDRLPAGLYLLTVTTAGQTAQLRVSRE